MQSPGLLINHLSASAAPFFTKHAFAVLLYLFSIAIQLGNRAGGESNAAPIALIDQLC
jgi:hypothetical protein